MPFLAFVDEDLEEYKAISRNWYNNQKLSRASALKSKMYNEVIYKLSTYVILLEQLDEDTIRTKHKQCRAWRKTVTS